LRVTCQAQQAKQALLMREMNLNVVSISQPC